jgi:hypothetical protein
LVKTNGYATLTNAYRQSETHGNLSRIGFNPLNDSQSGQ